MPYQCQRGGSIRIGAADDEMIVAMHQNSNHTISCFDARIVNRMADGEMVHHLALLGRQAVITVDLIVEERADTRGAQPERFGGTMVQGMNPLDCQNLRPAKTSRERSGGPSGARQAGKTVEFTCCPRVRVPQVSGTICQVGTRMKG